MQMALCNAKHTVAVMQTVFCNAKHTYAVMHNTFYTKNACKRSCIIHFTQKKLVNGHANYIFRKKTNLHDCKWSFYIAKHDLHDRNRLFYNSKHNLHDRFDTFYKKIYSKIVRK